MKTQVGVVVVGCILFSMGSLWGQIPTAYEAKEYKTLVASIQQKPIKDKDLYLLPSWTKDTTILLKDEVALAQIGDTWGRSFRLESKDPVLYHQVEDFPFMKIALSKKEGEKTPIKRRLYYEEQRLLRINADFDSAYNKSQKDLMVQYINLMVFYLRYSSVLSTENYTIYRESFQRMRSLYSSYVLGLCQKGQCVDADFRTLFALLTAVTTENSPEKKKKKMEENVAESLKDASIVLSYRYPLIEKYLRYQNDALKAQIKFDDITNYCLMSLRLYACGYRGISQQYTQDSLIRAFGVLNQTCPGGSEHVVANIKRYLAEYCDISF